MKLKTLLCAAVLAVATGPSFAQSNVTNVDTAKVRDHMDTLRNYLTRIQENSRLAWSTADVVHMDAYRRTNADLVDNASALAMNIKAELGPASAIPLGWGATRSYIDHVNNHLHHARMMADYTTAVDHAKLSLDQAYEAMGGGSAM